MHVTYLYSVLYYAALCQITLTTCCPAHPYNIICVSFLEPTQVCRHRNCISIGLSGFPGLTDVPIMWTYRCTQDIVIHTDHGTCGMHSNRPHLCDALQLPSGLRLSKSADVCRSTSERPSKVTGSRVEKVTIFWKLCKKEMLLLQTIDRKRLVTYNVAPFP